MVFVFPPATITEDYEELSIPNKSGSAVWTLTSYECTRYYKCAWSDRLTLAEKFRGSVAGAGNNIDINYTMPQSDPDVSSAVAVRVQVDPFDDKSSALSPTRIKYEFAQITVQFSTAAPQLTDNGGSGIALVSEDLEPWAEFLTLSNRGLYWLGGDALAEDEAPPLLVKGMAWVYRTHLQTSVPSAALSLVGKVNDDSITSATLGLTYDAETLLFTPPRLSIDTDAGGNRLISLEYRFNHRPDGWNNFFNPATQQYEQIFTDTGGANRFIPYPLDDFTTITG